MGIKNFALIEHMQLEFAKGITIFTGETGSGKSILMDAFSILLGERASSEFIRHEKDSFLIEGVFDIAGDTALQDLLLKKNILLEDDTLILSRTFNRNGKSQILANDQVIPLKALREIGTYLADIHGQYSNQQLLLPDTHHMYLDTYNEEATQAYESYVTAYTAYASAKRQLEKLREESAQRIRELDMLRFQIDEIEDAQLQPNEDTSVSEELERLDNFEHLQSTISSCYDGIYSGRTPLIDGLNTVTSEVSDLVKYDKDMEEIAELLRSAYYQLEEAGQALDRYRDSISYDEERYFYLQERDTLIYNLKRKYGDTIEAILDYEERAQSRLEILESHESEESQLVERLIQLEQQAIKALGILTKVRHTHHKEITEALQQNLTNLGMPKAKLEFVMEGTDVLSSLGASRIELLFSANAGEALLPLYKVASGGELARIALAFKTVFNKATHKTLVFDEIDVGISGDIALQVAKQILQLSSENQVFCITHLPQTASVTKQHYHLHKVEESGRTVSKVTVLSEEEHITQIARMMSGQSFSDTALETAKEMIQYFQQESE
jgi:DNA repair protein RecN